MDESILSQTRKWMVMAMALVVVMVMTLLPNVVFAAPPPGRQSLFWQNYYVGWSPDRTSISDRGYTLKMWLDNYSGSGFQSYSSYLGGYVSTRIKLVPGYSAGVVVAYYMSSPRTSTTTDWDEIDFEFLGNVTGQPWILQTNLFTSGKGDREQRIFLWFDPTTSFHSYSILWTPQQIVWYVDSVPIRIYRNTPTTSATYPKFKPMTIYGSVWNGDSWATRGGQDKINFAYAPFVVTFSKFYVDACKIGQTTLPTCYTNPSRNWWANYALSNTEKKLYRFYTKRYTVYNYCNDYPYRFPTQPLECKDTPW